MITLVIPVYKNSSNIGPLLIALTELHRKLEGELTVTFVVDGSPDDSFLRLQQGLPTVEFRSTVILLSRNFGSFAAIRAGLAATEAEQYAVMAADLQEPPELVMAFAERLTQNGAEVVIGRREGRDDPFVSRLMSTFFWCIYRRLVLPQIPPGGVDVFGCTRNVRDQILLLNEQNSSLVGLLLWVGFRREEVGYRRRAREHGKSAWTFRKKLRYLSDSIFNFTDLPIRLLTFVGLFGLLTTLTVAVIVLVARFLGAISVPGYTATVLLVMFFGTLNCLGLGLIGGYIWRTFENTKGRPNYIISLQQSFPGTNAVLRSPAGQTVNAQHLGSTT
ncbi:MAG: glycosyltransferase family 2 protein [Polyangiaceae bacterium]